MMKPEFMDTPDYLQLRAGGARFRMTRLRDYSAQHHAGDGSRWREFRRYGFHNWESAHATLDQGRNTRNGRSVPIWYTHCGEYFRNERDAHDIVRRLSRGWYTDCCDTSETAVGIVASLPHGRFIAGYRWTSNGERVWFSEVYTDEEDAACAANGHAESFAEDAREDSERFEAMQNAEIEAQDKLETLRDCLALRHTGRRTNDDVRDAIRELRDARLALADATRNYERG